MTITAPLRRGNLYNSGNGKEVRLMVSEAQKRASAKYREKKKTLALEFSPREFDVWEHLEDVKSRGGKKSVYVKNMLRYAMENPEFAEKMLESSE